MWASAHFDRTLAPWDNGRSAYSDAHQRFVHRFQVSTEGLNATKPEPHTYSAYIWPYFVEQQKGGPDFMSQIWAGLETVTTFEQVDDVIDTAHPFAQNFKTFALRNLNVGLNPGDPLPISQRYVNLDTAQFPDNIQPKYVTGDVPAELIADQEFRQDLDIDNLSARYLRFSPNGPVRKVEFDFTGLQPQDLTDVHVLVRTRDGGSNTWIAPPLDYSNENKAVFCLSEGPTTPSFQGDFIEMIIVVANHAKRSGEKVTGALTARPESKPCAVVWTGRSSIHITAPEGDYTMTGVATFEFDDTAVQLPGLIPYRLRSGDFSYDSRSPVPPSCTFINRGGGPMLKGPYDGITVGSTFAPLIINTTTTPPKYTLQTATVMDYIETDCQGNETTFQSIFNWASIGFDQEEFISEDGKTMQGSRDIVVEPSRTTTHHEWLFTKSLE